MADGEQVPTEWSRANVWQAIAAVLAAAAIGIGVGLVAQPDNAPVDPAEPATSSVEGSG